jgi:hypothetical protein
MADMSQMQELTSAERLKQGKLAVEQRDMRRARELLEPLVEEQPDNAEAWLWLSGAQSTPEDMAACLRRVLLLEPTNQDALDTIAWLADKHGPAVIGEPVEPDNLPVSAPENTSQRNDVSNPVPGTAHTARPNPQPDMEMYSEPDTDRRSQAPRRSSTGQHRAVPAPKHPGSRIYPTSPYAKPFERRQLLEYGIAVGGVGALLGLLRLAGQLRPGTLLLIRGSEGPITPAGAALIAIVAALVHGVALVAVWQVLARTVSTVRNDRQGDVADSLGRLASVFWPGYAGAVALVLVSLSLSAADGRWNAVIALVWLILLASIVMAGRRLIALLDAFGLDDDRRGIIMLRIVLPALLIGLLALGTAGLLVQRLLATI